MDPHNSLSREDLLKLLDVYAKNWLAMDGTWFLAVEETYGMDAAIAMDKRAWERFAVAEAQRIMRTFDIPASGGLAALAQAFPYRMYARVNEQEIEWIDAHTLRFRMVKCRVQTTRERKGLAPFPCKEVGMIEFGKFAQTIDPRIQMRCVACPPDPVAHRYCEWEYTLKPAAGNAIENEDGES
ncbi:MAG: hypothetical protein JXA10_03040 [Anaerolineae bacterium]|nr:hypothetical protein [Anaerolineae bacterium]